MKNLVITLALMVGVTGMAQAKGDAAAGTNQGCRLCGLSWTGRQQPSRHVSQDCWSARIIYQKQLVELKAAASGQTGRVAPVMGPMALLLSEQDMDDLAAYFSSQKVTPVAVPDDGCRRQGALYGETWSEAWPPVPPVMAHGVPASSKAEVSQPVRAASRLYQGPAHRFRSAARDNDPNGMMRDVGQEADGSGHRGALQVCGGASLDIAC